MQATVRWLDDVGFEATSGSGHTVIMDGAPEGGGRNRGCRPMELLLLGLGGCTAYDVVTILRKARQPIEDCVVELEAERAAEVPKVFTAIHLRYRVVGRGLSEKLVRRAVSLSKDKYCSASLMLASTAHITYDVSIEEPPGAEGGEATASD